MSHYSVIERDLAEIKQKFQLTRSGYFNRANSDIDRVIAQQKPSEDKENQLNHLYNPINFVHTTNLSDDQNSLKPTSETLDSTLKIIKQSIKKQPRDINSHKQSKYKNNINSLNNVINFK